jgi:predicted ATPase/DNA-binding NarL/FixJ family response regulator
MPSRTRARPGNLPYELTSFIGRRAEVQAAKRQTAQSRLVTLTGAGGVGKTRLAVHVGEVIHRVFPDGVWLVELDGVHDETLVPQTVATVLGLKEVPGRSPMTQLAGHLADRQPLLVLDNCEHLVAGVARLAEDLLRDSPRLRILATSREPLDATGEVLLPLAPLPTPDPGQEMSAAQLVLCDAVALFVDRARSVSPAFALTDDNAAAVARICHRLDGLPLAIELATAWLQVLSPAQIDERLGDRLALLTRGSRAPSRHQTLRACMAWSFGLCSEAEQRLWMRMAVFAAAVEPDAVAEVCGGAGLREAIASLEAKSILTREQHGSTARFRMLESIRSYGLDRLREAGAESELRRRHLDRYERLVLKADADWIGPRQPEWVERLAYAHPEIRAALQFSVDAPERAGSALRIGAAMHPHWHIRGLTSEGRHWLDRALTVSTEPTVDRVKATFTACVLAAMQGDLDIAKDLVRQARQAADHLGDPWSDAMATLTAAAPQTHSGNAAGGAKFTAAALEKFRALNDVHWMVSALSGLAMVQAFLGDAAGATASHEALLAVTEARGEIRHRGLALWALGISQWARGDPEQAAGRLRESLRLRDRMNDTLGTVLCLDALAWVAAHRGQARRAAILLGAVAALSRSMGAPAATYPDLVSYHDECVRQTRAALGEQAYRHALAQGERTSLPDVIGYALTDHDARQSAGPAEAGVTRREWQICELVADGLSNREIAARLVISTRTAESHVQHVLDKLGLANRTLITAWVEQQRDARH